MLLNPFKKKTPPGIGPEPAGAPPYAPQDATDPLVPSGRWQEEVAVIAAGPLFKLERIDVQGDKGAVFSFLRLVQTGQPELAGAVRELLLQLPEAVSGFNDLLLLETAPLAASLALPDACLTEYAVGAEPEYALLRPVDLLDGLREIAQMLSRLHAHCGLAWAQPAATGIGLLHRPAGRPAGLARWQMMFTGWGGLELGAPSPARDLLAVFAPAWEWLSQQAAQQGFAQQQTQVQQIQHWLAGLAQDDALDYPALVSALDRLELKFVCHAATDPGRKREHNEDAYLLSQLNQCSMFGAELSLAAVADGMGGHQSGEVASSLALDLLRQQLTQGLLPPRSSLVDPHQLAPQLTAVIPLIGRLLSERAELEQRLSGMGTTLCGLAALRVQSTASAARAAWEAAVFNVGDSRAYLVTPAGLWRLTADHSYVQELVDQGELTPDQAFEHKMKNVITRCLGGNGSDGTPDVAGFTPGPAEAVLICSDGLSDALRDVEIQQAIGAASRQGDVAVLRELVRAANAAGGPDNITVLLAAMEPEFEAASTG